MTYIDGEGKWHRVSKGAPEQVHFFWLFIRAFLASIMANLNYGFGMHFQILNLAHNKSDIERRVHAVIDKFAERGLRSLAVAYQVFIHSNVV